MIEFIKDNNQLFTGKKAEEAIAFALEHFGENVAFASSLGLEDQVITSMIASINPGARIFTLDTGRLFPETYELIHNTNMRFGIRMEVYFPSTANVESMVNSKGINLFYESIENRKLCCTTRKVEPLKRAFSGLEAWICGLRRDQSITRADLQLFEWDETNKLIKINPLIDWTEEMLWDYIRKNNVPYHPLHDKGFPSIGCQPCTREVLPGENIRAGRWWWENPETRECGLHAK
jgi:phosphoadenosine phosphosulfate reductase